MSNYTLEDHSKVVLQDVQTHRSLFRLYAQVRVSEEGDIVFFKGMNAHRQAVA